MRSYKPSKYNLTQPSGDYFLLANTFSGAVGLIDENIRNLLERLPSGQEGVDAEVISVLKKNGYIVPYEMNEYQRILDLEKRAIFERSDVVFLIIAPTLKCNYRCEYCYEPLDSSSVDNAMDQSTINEVKTYIKSKLANNVKKLIITWFGGEPLMALHSIEAISADVIEYCQDVGVDYHAEIITNGFYLTEDIAKHLTEDLNVSSAQVTFDGPENVYEQVKHAPRGAFKRVLNNVLAASKYLNINLRLNVSENEFDTVNDFADYLLQYFAERKNIKLYLAEVCDDWSDYCGQKEVRSTSFWLKNHEFVSRMKEKNPERLGASNVPLAFCGMKCGMVKKHNAVIGPNGELYRCAHMVGRPAEVIGNCADGLFHNAPDKKFDTINHPDRCIECNVFPICMTGCPNDALLGKQRVSCEVRRREIEHELFSKAGEQKETSK